MRASQTERERQKRGWHFYLISGLGFLLTLVIIAAIVYFWEEIQQGKAYGYAGGFLISILGGVTVIPAPSLAVTFALGRVLNPVYVGLISGLGEAIGGITIYLSGAGVETVWTRFQSKEKTLERRLGLSEEITGPGPSSFWARGEVFYNRLVNWVGSRGGALVVFAVAAVPLSPFYFAGLAAGSLRMGLLRFFLASWGGKTIKGLTIAFAGYGGLYFLLQWIGS